MPIALLAKAPSRNDDVTSQKRDDDTPPKTNSPGSPARVRGRPRTAARFKEREVARLLKAMRRAGGSFRLEFADGSFFIVDQAPATTNTDPNPWDEVHAADKERSA
jgi:hypothetical protein